MSRPKNLREGVWINYNSDEFKDIPFLIEHGDQTFSFYTRKIHAKAIDGTEIDLAAKDLDIVSVTQAPSEKQFKKGDTVRLLPSFPMWVIRNGLFYAGELYLVNRVGNKGSINLIDEKGRSGIYVSSKYFLHVEKVS